MANYDAELDLCNIPAPAHLLRARRALESMEVGQTLSVMTTVPTAIKDFELWAEHSGNTLLEKHALANKFHLVMLKR
ncbi:MAG: sulfurtransferase TusA family protein [Pseudomonadota bacterium]|nr:sulfurtransferase TusA family protein [Pseudomonadota bacterium]